MNYSMTRLECNKELRNFLRLNVQSCGVTTCRFLSEFDSSVCANADDTANKQEDSSKDTTRPADKEWVAQPTETLKESTHQTKKRDSHAEDSSAKSFVSYSGNSPFAKKHDSYSENPTSAKNGDSYSENVSSAKRQVSCSEKCPSAKKRDSYHENSTSAKKRDSYSENGPSAKKRGGFFGVAVTAKKLPVREPLLQIINITPDDGNHSKQPRVEPGDGKKLYELDNFTVLTYLK